MLFGLASLALASEPPIEELLQRPPVNRTDSMISTRMWANMLGQASYQICAVMTLLFAGPKLLNLEAGHIVEDNDQNSVHYTLIFNSFVWMQLFNEINCRKLKGECKFSTDHGDENEMRMLDISTCLSSFDKLCVIPLTSHLAFLEI